jgi:hypothetical protein
MGKLFEGFKISDFNHILEKKLGGGELFKGDITQGRILNKETW